MLPAKKSIQIYILSRNRLQYLKHTLPSVLSQTSTNCLIEVIVSDNSTNHEVQQYIEEHYSTLRYIRRNPPVSQSIHFGLISIEATADYVVFFHDDDIMLPNYTQKIIEAFSLYPEASGVGTNAMIIDSSGAELGPFSQRELPIVVTDEAWFVNQYVPRADPGPGISPLPSYCFRRSSLNYHDWDEKNGGSCADVAFISKKLRYGSLVWLPDILMQYRVHADSLSSIIGIDDYRRLWRYLISAGVNKDDPEFQTWRHNMWFNWYTSKQLASNPSFIVRPSGWRDYKIHKAFLKKHLKRPRRLFLRMLLGLLAYKAKSLIA